jgi:hypothetical protein
MELLLLRISSSLRSRLRVNPIRKTLLKSRNPPSPPNRPNLPSKKRSQNNNSKSSNRSLNLSRRLLKKK